MLKKTTYFLLAFFFISQGVHSQSSLGSEGNMFKLASGYSNHGIPVYLAYELSIPDVISDITFGMEGTYRTFNEKNDTTTLNHSIGGFSFFSNYYFNSLFDMDPRMKWFVYGGISLSYYKWFSPEGYFELGQSSSTLAAGIHVGGQYFFKDWGIYLEAGGGTENFAGKLGVMYRFDY